MKLFSLKKSLIRLKTYPFGASLDPIKRYVFHSPLKVLISASIKMMQRFFAVTFMLKVSTNENNSYPNYGTLPFAIKNN